MDFNPAKLRKCLISDLGISESRPLTSDMTLRDARKNSLLASVLKKYVAGSEAKLEMVAVDGFKASNAHCAAVVLPRADSYVGEILTIARSLIHAAFYHLPGQQTDFNLHECVLRGRTGPGASKGTKRTDFLGKMFEGDLSVTSQGLYNHYRTCITGRWAEAESFRRHKYATIVTETSSLTTVPKNCETNRTICTEPSLNMFYQLGAGDIINGMLKRDHNIDLSTQPDVNRAMAQTGSLAGNFATIDLRSASDTISYELCRALLPRGILAVLDIIRCHATEYKGETIALNMISSMGNGFTFSLQTLIFASLVRASYMLMGITPKVRVGRNYAVFGDDIICLTEAYHVVCQVLNGCGFIVNDQKSFASGAFRESCGGDFFKGDDIRGVYIKKVTIEQDLYTAFNRLCRWSARYSISLHHTLLYVKGLASFRPVPLHEGDDAGHKIPSSLLQTPKFSRSGCWVYSPTVPVRRTIEVSGGVADCVIQGRIISVLGGYIRGNKIGVRSQSGTEYEVARAMTPNWDYCADAGLTSRDYFQCLIGTV